ncbi:MAG: hypothetical protein ACOH1L_08430 [Thermomonas sp.]
MIPAAPASLLTIFGDTGDLAQRMLLPSLFSLQAEGLLPPGLRILGTERSELDREAFAGQVANAINEAIPAPERSDATVAGMLERLDSCTASVDDDASMATLAERVNTLRNGDVPCHLRTAPRLYVPTCHALGAHGAAGAGTRVMLEKPIGKVLASAEAINDGVAEVFDEDRVYRVDHDLGKEGMQNLMALRFGNALFEPQWNARHIEQMQITVAETVGVEGRGDHYDLPLMSKTPGLDRSGLRLSQVVLDLDFHAEFSASRKRLAYERLYLDAIEGNGTLFVRRDETDAAWQWVDAILDGWHASGTLPKPYPAGTWGPMIERHGHSWRE